MCRWQKYWIVFLLVGCLASSFFPRAIILHQDLAHRFASISRSHPLGTDALGRDTLFRLLAGCRVSLSVGCCATAIALALGTAVGLASGYFGGAVDYCLMRCVDVLHTLPLTLLVLLFLVFIGNGFFVLCLAIGFGEWFTLSRVVRASTLDIRRSTFVQAAFSLGQSHWRILVFHIFPNLRPLVAGYVWLLLPNAILLEAFLSFLGLGVPPPNSSLGNMIAEAVSTMGTYPILLLAPAAFLLATLLAFTTLQKSP